MTKAKVFFIALIALFALASYSCTREVRGEGAGSGLVNRQGERKEPEAGKTQAPVSKKKPRLKYWDPYECGC